MGLSGKIILLTGGTGSFGKEFVETVLREHNPKAIRIFSRGELLQMQMRQQFNDDPRLRFLIGDVRDRARLSRAMNGVDIVVHAAALKQVPACEYNPIEAIKTNVDGAVNVIDAAIDANVMKVIALSTDKAVNPANLYGATKLCAEKLFVRGNAYAGGSETRFSCVRYGNVIGSRGSVIPVFQRQRESGKITITDKRMTRFWLTLDQGVRFVIRCIEQMQGGEIFVPKIPSMRIMELAEAIAPGCEIELTGIRPGEKLHEVLVSEDESRDAHETEDMFVICPVYGYRGHTNSPERNNLPDGFKYTSDTNEQWLSQSELTKLVEGIPAAE